MSEEKTNEEKTIDLLTEIRNNTYSIKYNVQFFFWVLVAGAGITVLLFVLQNIR